MIFCGPAIVVTQQCEWEETISDDAFGFWDDTWGHPTVHTFTCDSDADFVVDVEGYEGPEDFAFCAKHTLEVL